MKTKIMQGINVLIAAIILQSCSIFSYSEKTPKYSVDLVCGMKVNRSDAYTWQYKGSKYYFDNYNCKQSFKMNPEKFLSNKCVNPNDTIPKK